MIALSRVKILRALWLIADPSLLIRYLRTSSRLGRTSTSPPSTGVTSTMAHPQVPLRTHLLPPVGSLVDTLDFPTNQIVVGPPGSGKTVLALHAAHRASQRGSVHFVVASEHLVRWLRRQVDVEQDISIATWRHWLSTEYARLANREAVPLIDQTRRRIDWQAISLRSSRSAPAAGHYTGQVIVDEAQDVPTALIRLMRAWGYAVLALADPVQRFADEGSELEDLVDAISGTDPWPVFVLEEDYRTTSPIQSFATRSWARGRMDPSRPARREGPPPRIHHGSLDAVLQEVEAARASTHGASIAVATGYADRVAVVTLLRNARIPVRRTNDDDDEGDDGVHVLPFEALRGLEFDTVVLVLPESRSQEHEDVDRLRAHLYVAATRSRRVLSIVVRPGVAPELLSGFDPTDRPETEAPA
jgi:DNA helicase II / ATP-dependent DNA helicase PcrA